MLKQQIKDSELINLCTADNLNTNMWKYQMIREMENAKKQELQSIIDLPSYAAFVKTHELEWGKKRSEFNELEKESIERKYYKLKGESYR